MSTFERKDCKCKGYGAIQSCPNCKKAYAKYRHDLAKSRRERFDPSLNSNREAKP
jgi:hypothetical protein